MTAIATLYKWFSDLKKPNGAQFKALIDSFWHKSEQISMSSIDGLDRIIEGTASDQQLQNHLSDTNAHKGLFDGKVDKVEGKGLSSNDFTNTYKQQLDTLEDYDIDLDENTTELKFKKGNNVIKRISLMFLDDEGTKLVYNKVNKTLELRDKRDNLLTSIPVSHFVSNIPTGIVVQNGKIKLMAGSEVIGENTISYNDLADKPELNFAPTNHTHNWDDIDGKPNNLATTESVKKAIDGIQIGGRNLLLNSGVVVTNSNYQVASYQVTEDINIGDTITLSIDADVPKNCQIVLLNGAGGGAGGFGNLREGVNVWDNEKKVSVKKGGSFLVYVIGNNEGTKETTIRKIKLERGNKVTDWSPAPEDLESKIPQYKKITDAHSFLDKDGAIHFGSGSGILNAPTSHFYEMVGFTHSDKKWGFIIAKNIDDDDKCLYIKQVIEGIYKEWFKLEDRSNERTINVTASTFNITPDIVGKTLHINNSCIINYNTMPLLTTVAIRKIFDGGEVKFTGAFEAIYTGDRVLNGKKGSTAIVDYSAANNTIFIDIRNV